VRYVPPPAPCRKTLQRHRITQQAIADEFGYTPTHISRIMLGYAPAPLWMARILAKRFGTEPERLFHRITDCPDMRARPEAVAS
jgi:transcriptional regulator with XRE-family HTH domain